ncbi:hypothetical protein [Myroides sp. N17-2]|uniref:hypothetical protein n=1 Tax=Myroides sp. N17-2 TaxID=2030799 RepID=UPI000EFD9BA0|nr:hypothetical protein [Myroides sp. N17-2]
MKGINEEQLYIYFLETIDSCGGFLLECNDEKIGYLIFEVFDINVRTFFYSDTLTKLLSKRMISQDIYHKAIATRDLYLSIEDTSLWSISGVRESTIWKEIFDLCDDIRTQVNAH